MKSISSPSEQREHELSPEYLAQEDPPMAARQSTASREAAVVASQRKHTFSFGQQNDVRARLSGAIQSAEKASASIASLPEEDDEDDA